MIAALLKTCGYALGAGVIVARDGIADFGGSAIPYQVEQFLTPEYFSQMLNDHALTPRAAPVSIDSLEILPVKSTSSNCNNVVVNIGGVDSAVLPEQLFVKLPMADLGTRWFFDIIGSWQLESYFCRHVAPHVPLRTPKTFATASQRTRFFLVQENLHQDPDVQLFTNMQMLGGPPMDIVYRCLDAFAQLHACHYGLSESERSRILPIDNHPFISPRLRHVSRTLNNFGLAPCVRQCLELLPEPVIALYRKTLKHWDCLLEDWFSGPLCLLHGDSHIGNFFVSGEQMGMLDFQAVHWGKGIRDVQYFLVDSLPAELLARQEQDLVRYYVERRAVHGDAIDFHTTWQDYRGFSYHTLMTIVVSIGFGALNDEHGDLMKEVLRRAVAAVQRLDYQQWLDKKIASKA